MLQRVPVLRQAASRVIAGVGVAALHPGRDLLTPLALAAPPGFLRDPAVRRLKRGGLPRAGRRSALADRTGTAGGRWHLPRGQLRLLGTGDRALLARMAQRWVQAVAGQ